MSIHILYTPAKFHFEIQTLSKVIEKQTLRRLREWSRDCANGPKYKVNLTIKVNKGYKCKAREKVLKL